MNWYKVIKGAIILCVIFFNSKFNEVMTDRYPEKELMFNIIQIIIMILTAIYIIVYL